MRSLKSLVITCMLLVVVFAPMAIGVPQGPAQADVDGDVPTLPEPEPETVRLVVGYADTWPTLADEILEHHAATIVRTDTTLRFTVVTVPEATADTLREMLPFVPGIRYAHEDGIIEAHFTPNDPQYINQWGPAAISMEEAWDTTLGDHTIEVAVLDTGVDYGHLDLTDNVCRLGPDFHNGDDDPIDDHYHGTHVAGTVAGRINNAVGVAGMADACVVPVKVLSAGGWGYWSNLASAIQWAADNGTEIISMSLGGCCDPGEPLRTAVQNAYSADVLIIASAGNAYCNNVGFPAAYPEVVAIGSLAEPGDARSSFSSCGPQVEVSAPGSDIISTMPNQDYGYLSGTSMAAPHVSGVAALFWSQHPNMTAAEVRCILAQNAVDLGTPGPDEETGFGRIDAAKMLANPECVPQVPFPPRFTAMSGDGTAALSWSEPFAWGGVDGYRIYRSTNSLQFTLLLDTNETSFEDTTATPGTTYYYKVTAYNGAGEGDGNVQEVLVRYAVELPYGTGFESGLGEWQATGAWHASNARSGSGEFSAFFGNEGGGYPDDADDTLTSPPIRIPANTSTHLSFWTFMDLEHWVYDLPTIEVATLDDPSGFERVWEMGGFEVYEGPGAVDLSDYAGQVVYLRFHITTDFCCGGEGWYVDDLLFQTGAPPEIPPIMYLFYPYPDSYISGNQYLYGAYLDGNGAADVDNVTIINGTGGIGYGETAPHRFTGWVHHDGSGPTSFEVILRDRTMATDNATLDVVVDADPPEVVLAAPAEGSAIGCRIDLSGSVSDVGSGARYMYVFAPNASRFVWLSDDQNWSVNLPVGWSPPGPLDIRFYAVDRVGNSHDVTYTFERNDDDCRPHISVIAPGAGATVGGLVNLQAAIDWAEGTSQRGEVIFTIDGEDMATRDRHGDGTVGFTWNSWLTENGTHTISIGAYPFDGSPANVTTFTVFVDNDRDPRLETFVHEGTIDCAFGLGPVATTDVCDEAQEMAFGVVPGVTALRIVIEWDEDAPFGTDVLQGWARIGAHTFPSQSDGPGRIVIEATHPTGGIFTTDIDELDVDVRAAGGTGPHVVIDEAFQVDATVAYWNEPLP